MKDKEESHKKEVERKLKKNEKKIEKLAKDGDPEDKYKIDPGYYFKHLDPN